jgi:glycosyltransferase involved in cell wall biosynthesis
VEARSPALAAGSVRVVHLVDAMGSTHLWGKERAIAALMLRQRSAGIATRLVAFAPNELVELLAARGFRTDVLGRRPRRVPLRALTRLIALLHAEPAAVLHTHGYKANIVGRAARAAGAPIRRLVATVHGMNDETRALAFYNRLDRFTAPFSHAVAVADAQLPPSFPRAARVTYVANAIADQAPFGPAERAAARRRFGLAEDAFVVGLLGRVTAAKGALDVLAAARACADPRIVFAFAGDGELVRSTSVPANVRFVGYVDDADAYLPALDAYLQASHTEGLSLALLEAMRGGLACIATRVGSTERAIDDGRDGLLIPPGDPPALRAAVERLAADEPLRARLAAAARARFAAEFTMDRHHRAYLSLYGASDAERLPLQQVPLA